MARVTNNNVYDDDDDDYDPDCPDCDDTINPIPGLMVIIFSASLCCTVGSLLYDIPLIIMQFISTKVISNNTFRALVS